MLLNSVRFGSFNAAQATCSNLKGMERHGKKGNGDVRSSQRTIGRHVSFESCLFPNIFRECVCKGYLQRRAGQRQLWLSEVGWRLNVLPVQVINWWNSGLFWSSTSRSPTCTIYKQCNLYTHNIHCCISYYNIHTLSVSSLRVTLRCTICFTLNCKGVFEFADGLAFCEVLAAGCFSGACIAATLHPLFVVKTHQQVPQQNWWTVHGIFQLCFCCASSPCFCWRWEVNRLSTLEATQRLWHGEGLQGVLKKNLGKWTKILVVDGQQNIEDWEIVYSSDSELSEMVKISIEEVLE